MSPAQRAYRMEVSDYYFRLTTECVRLFSNAVLRYCTINDVVNERSGLISSVPGAYEAKQVREHLRLIPSSGDVVIEITILDTSAKHIDDALVDLEDMVGSSVTFKEALSIILFDFLVEGNLTEVLTKLGLSADDAREYKEIARRLPSNVVPIR